MLIDMLLQEAKGMTDDAILEVVRFIQFLKIAPVKNVSSFAAQAGNEGKKVYRKPGLYKEQIKIADGFDDPLDDFEENM